MIPPSSQRGVNALFLSGLQLHPTISGGTLRSFALANSLAHHGIGVRVHSLTGRKSDYLARRPSSVQCWPGGVEEYVDRSLPSAAAWLGGYVLGLPPLWITAHLAIAAAAPRQALLPFPLRRKLESCDTIVADSPFLHPIFSVGSVQGRLRILSTHNVEHRLCGDPARWRSRLMRAVVRAIEVRAAEASDILVCCCEDDARFFAANARVRRIIVVPNGVDVQRFRGIEEHRARTRQELSIADDVRLFLFTASKWGPNREAFDYLLGFVKVQGRMLEERRIHILVVGNVVTEPVRLPALTATGPVRVVDPYFAAADAALNPIVVGAGTNVKMREFLALRVPIVSTPFGARGLVIDHGRTGFLFDRKELASALCAVRRLFDEDPGRLRQMAADAYARNESVVDMDACVQGLADAMLRREPA
jgi:glycosyltransferase involved in cell wall biosynthesis